MSTAHAGPATTSPDPVSGGNGVVRRYAAWRKRLGAVNARVDDIVRGWPAKAAAMARAWVARVFQGVWPGDPGAGSAATA
jgi:hypothetical protein